MSSAEITTDQSQLSNNQNSQTLEKLNQLVTESMQIYELENQKLNIINDIYNSLKTITEFLKFSINIHPLIFNLSGDTLISLLPNLDVIIKRSNSKTTIKSFNELSPDLVIRILEYIIPQILDLINVEKAELTNKVTLLREMTKQINDTQLLKDHIKTDIGNEVQI